MRGVRAPHLSGGRAGRAAGVQRRAAATVRTSQAARETRRQRVALVDHTSLIASCWSLEPISVASLSIMITFHLAYFTKIDI